MNTTRYFAEQVLSRRPYLTVDLCRGVLAQPLRREVQEDGRVRTWARSPCQATAAGASYGL
ncbi:MAG: hypothetical protein ABW194_09355 [Novosphingobium sp.]